MHFYEALQTTYNSLVGHLHANHWTMQNQSLLFYYDALS